MLVNCDKNIINFAIRYSTSINFKIYVLNYRDHKQIPNCSILTNLFNLLYGKTAAIRVFGIGFEADVTNKQLILKVGYSHVIKTEVSNGITVKVREDERKKPNIIWVFSYDYERLKTYTNMIQKHKKISIFVRKRLTGLLYLNEFKTLKFKKWKDKRKKRN